MNEFKHTPAPWKVKNGIDRIYIEDSNGEEVAQITNRGFYNTEANAKLISASPKMIDALIDALELIAGDSNVSHFDTVDKIKSAIEKATNP
jgi:hypothetical protein